MGNAVSASDRYGRSVYYTTTNQNTTHDATYFLTQVSQLVPTGTSNPPVRYGYTYASLGTARTGPANPT